MPLSEKNSRIEVTIRQYANIRVVMLGTSYGVFSEGLLDLLLELSLEITFPNALVFALGNVLGVVLGAVWGRA